MVTVLAWWPLLMMGASPSRMLEFMNVDATSGGYAALVDPDGVDFSCSFSAYPPTSYHAVKGAATVNECIDACEAEDKCTGLEYMLDRAGAECYLWFERACSSIDSPGLRPCATAKTMVRCHAFGVAGCPKPLLHFPFADRRRLNREQSCNIKSDADADLETKVCTSVLFGTSSRKGHVLTRVRDLGLYRCPSFLSKLNTLDGDSEHGYEDTFTLSQRGSTVTVIREDANHGWGLNMKFECCKEKCFEYKEDRKGKCMLKNGDVPTHSFLDNMYYHNCELDARPTGSAPDIRRDRVRVHVNPGPVVGLHVRPRPHNAFSGTGRLRNADLAKGTVAMQIPTGRRATRRGAPWFVSKNLLCSAQFVCYTFVENAYASLAWRNGSELVNYRAGVSLV
eukprot:CAMPEP_0119306394 /NCGR_PEP_ID=MMETSP1333-20130426/7168_1 /TAXON_ID=418940 /ORGANISM="Scyphosphaera apsteinii, Strain RCC1455" /LENGTH=393 /DNA_ID=CAMNT_0007309691 /DNA_START=236 /DNA_END=1414 /DNA_ORIENTATION=+